MSELDDEFEALVDGRLSAEEWVERSIARTARECAECAGVVEVRRAEREEARWLDPARWPEPWARFMAATEAEVVAGGRSRQPGDAIRRAVDRTMKNLRALPADERVAKIERSWTAFNRPELVDALV